MSNALFHREMQNASVHYSTFNPQVMKKTANCRYRRKYCAAPILHMGADVSRCPQGLTADSLRVCITNHMPKGLMSAGETQEGN